MLGGAETMDVRKILIVDDEEQLRSLVRLYLEQDRFVVDEAVDGRETLLKIRKNEYDLVVLDLMMPELDGWDVCRQVRQDNIDIPNIMLTAKTEMEDKLIGFECGADDYVGKPFDPRELVARIHALLRRTKTETTKERIVWGTLNVNPVARSVWVKERELFLTAKEFDLLLLMVKNQGRVFSRDELLEWVWGHDFFGESRTVDSPHEKC
jgi:two-component system response regulator ResD